MAPPAAVEVLPETDTSTFTVPDRLTIQYVAKRRAASGKLIAGAAAPADVEAYKGLTHHLHKNKAKRWDHRFTDEAKNRGGSSLKEGKMRMRSHDFALALTNGQYVYSLKRAHWNQGYYAHTDLK
jgi:hypothetical protein